MAFGRRWLRRVCLDERARRSEALNVWTLTGPSLCHLICGTVVDAPRYYQDELSDRVRRYALDIGWDGKTHSVPGFLRELESRIAKDDLALQTIHIPMNRGGVSIGGIALAGGHEAVAFRHGLFRVFLGERVVLWEQTLLREAVAVGARLDEPLSPLLQTCFTVWPAVSLGEESVVRVPEEHRSVRVVYARDFTPSEEVPAPGISIEALWGDTNWQGRRES